MDLTDIKTIKALLARHGFHFSKSMGQNFLIADWVPRDIAEAAGLDEGCGVLEIGPGIGPLTVQLAQRAGRVAAIELDRALLPILAETLAGYPNAQVIPGDVMKLDLAALAAEQFSGLAVNGLRQPPLQHHHPGDHHAAWKPAACQSITVMIQREVARRICAGAGQRRPWGLLRVLPVPRPAVSCYSTWALSASSLPPR